MLDPVPTVPQTWQGEVVGVDGRVIVATAGGLVTLCVVRPSERALVVLDAAGARALQQLLAEAAR